MDKEFVRYRANVAAEYLDRVRGLGKRIKSLSFAINNLRLTASGVTGIDYSEDKIKTTPNDDRIPNTLTKMDELIEELTVKRGIYEKEIDAVIRAFNRMENQKSAAIIEMHYVADRTWRECAEELHYTKDGMMDARQNALSDFYDVMPQTQIEEIPEAI